MKQKSPIDQWIDSKANDLARLDNKTTAQVRTQLSYAFVFVAIAAVLFGICVFVLNTSKDQAVLGITWFASFIAFIVVISSLVNLAQVVRELMKRKD